MTGGKVGRGAQGRQGTTGRLDLGVDVRLCWGDWERVGRIKLSIHVKALVVTLMDNENDMCLSTKKK